LHWIHVIGFHFITLWLLLRFFCTAARSFHDDYFNYKTDFQLTTLNGCGITGWILLYLQIRLHNFDTGWVLSHIFADFFSGFVSNHKKTLLQWLLYLHAKFHPIPSSGLLCRCDRPSTPLMRKLIIL